jgi:hypothetical protein
MQMINLETIGDRHSAPWQVHELSVAADALKFLKGELHDR